jgi:hypothetical protein
VHPDASVETELVRADERGITVRADISWPIIVADTVHIVHSSGYALETWEKPGRIGAPLENAETSAVGRALAAAGFGTQFAPEMDFDAGGDRVVDSPAQRTQTRPTPPQGRETAPPPQQPAQGQPARQAANAAADAENIAPTDKQIKFMRVKAEENGWEPAEVSAVIRDTFDKASSKELTRLEMSRLIEILQAGTGAPA